MSWKKNVLSYLLWIAYVLITCSALVGLASLFCAEKGFETYWGTLAAVLYAAVVSVIVFFIHRLVVQASVFVVKNRGLFLLLEAVFAVMLLAVGLVLRIQGMGEGGGTSLYYETAEVVLGQEIPRITHGAVFFYVQLLHGVLALFGNYAAVGIWVQIALQFTAFLILFFTVRKLAGSVAALVFLGICMCAPFMVQSALSLSPEMLFFCLTTLAAWLIAMGRGRLRPVWYLPVGILTAVCGYLDVTGFMLLIWGGAVICCQREEANVPVREIWAALLCLAGTALGFAGCILIDAFLSGKTFVEIAGAWWLLYSPEGFRFPVAVGNGESELESIVLMGIMVFGIFSFWCDLQRERVRAAMLSVCSVILAACYGVFTSEMPGFFYLYLLFAILAGVGVGECFRTAEVPERIKEDDIILEWELSADHGEWEKGVENSDEITATGTDMISVAQQAPSGEIKFIENPLPLPKKHEKRVLDFPMKQFSENDDFDYSIGADDDFDI